MVGCDKRSVAVWEVASLIGGLVFGRVVSGVAGTRWTVSVDLRGQLAKVVFLSVVLKSGRSVLEGRKWVVFVGVDTGHVQGVKLVLHEVALVQVGFSAMVNGSH